MQITIKKYAPVLIPTLNRYKHLHRLITSLQGCSGVEHTELYISVDYPPRKEYVEGWEKVCAFCREGLTNFAKVHLFFQEENLGAYGNEMFLLELVEKTWDRYIFLEDDNECFRSFLEYMNKGLEFFENDENAVAVCAAGATGVEVLNGNICKVCDFSPYGFGVWSEKYIACRKLIQRSYFVELSRDYRRLCELFQYDAGLFFAFVCILLKKGKPYVTADGEVPIIDMSFRIYLFFEKRYCIFPAKQLTYNYGQDGSGCNAPMLKIPKRPVPVEDTSAHFEYDIPDEFGISNRECPVRKNSLELLLRKYVALFKIFIFRLLGEKNYFLLRYKIYKNEIDNIYVAAERKGKNE